MTHNEKLLLIIGHGLSANPASFEQIMPQLALHAEQIQCEMSQEDWDLVESIIMDSIAAVGGAA